MDCGDVAEENIVIIGGGIVGAATAYYLTQSGAKRVTVVERTSVACHASGKAGGFLARDWYSRTTKALHTVSFALHEELATALQLTSYRPITTLDVGHRAARGENVASWVRKECSVKDSGTAQVDPSELTHALMQAACEQGASLREGTAVTGLAIADKAVVGVYLSDGSTLPCTRCIVAMGVWSVLLEEWAGLAIAMEGICSSSLVFQGPRHPFVQAGTEPFALFCPDDENGCHLEVYPRPDGSVYVCGCGGSKYISGASLREGGGYHCAEALAASDERVTAALASLQGLLVADGATSPRAGLHTQACMRPCPSDCLPVLGKVPGCRGLYVACGHNCWGILWGPVTGKAMSELVLRGAAACVDLAPFTPARFGRKGAAATRHDMDW